MSTDSIADGAGRRAHDGPWTYTSRALAPGFTYGGGTRRIFVIQRVTLLSLGVMPLQMGMRHDYGVKAKKTGLRRMHTHPQNTGAGRRPTPALLGSSCTCRIQPSSLASQGTRTVELHAECRWQPAFTHCERSSKLPPARKTQRQTHKTPRMHLAGITGLKSAWERGPHPVRRPASSDDSDSPRPGASNSLRCVACNSGGKQASPSHLLICLFAFSPAAVICISSKSHSVISLAPSGPSSCGVIPRPIGGCSTGLSRRSLSGSRTPSALALSTRDPNEQPQDNLRNPVSHGRKRQVLR